MSIYDVMAIYFGDWHVDPDMQSLHGPNWTEWGLVTSATPRQAPRRPLTARSSADGPHPLPMDLTLSPAFSQVPRTPAGDVRSFPCLLRGVSRYSHDSTPIQPNLPHDELPGWGVRAEENTPAAMRVKADRALQSGVDAFLFDWYWYAEKGTDGKGGAFLNGALDDGFLPLTAGSNATKLKFALMWANQAGANHQRAHARSAAPSGTD